MINDTENSGITIRRLSEKDEAAIERLSQLDSHSRPAGQLMGAEIEGRLLVATSVETGESVADPFSRTVELRDLIGIRIAQLSGEPRRKRFRRPRARARGSLAGSPPGAGGKLLELPVRMS
jgi:hypothetical protein